MAPSGELKTKPTQHSVAALRSIGITPDALILRCDRDVPEPLKNKIALMCDVDIDGVISTPDAPSIYDIPKVLHREELDAYVVRRLNLPFRDVDWTRVERPAAARARAAGDRADRVGGQVHRPVRCVPVGRRGAARRRLQAPREGRDAVGGLRRLRNRQRRRRGAQRRARRADPRRLRHPRHRGQDRRDPLRPQTGPAGPRAVSRLAVHRHRGGPVGRAHRGQLRGVRSEHPRSGDLHDGRSARRRRRRGRPRRHHAAGRLPRRARAGFHCGAGVSDHRGVRAAPAPLRGQQRLPRPHRRKRAEVLRHLARRAPGRVRRVRRRCPPVPRRHPGPPGAEEPAHPAASAVRRVHRRGAGLQGRRAVAGWRSPSSERTAPSIPDNVGQLLQDDPRKNLEVRG